MSNAGVDRVYVSLIDLAGAEEVKRFGRVIDGCRIG